MKFADIPKFVINLDRRPDRLESITKEMEYIGWDFERFAAIDTNSYMGITKSTFEIIKIAKERKYPRVMLIEDDCGFMPYSRDLLNQIEETQEDDYSIRRPVFIPDFCIFIIYITIFINKNII